MNRIASADESARQMAMGFQYCTQAIALEDPGTRNILACNAAFADLFGYAIEELVGRSFARLFYPPLSGKMDILCAENPGRICHAATMLRKDGTVFPARLDLTTVEEHGDCCRVITLHDLTGTHYAQAILNSVPAEIAVLNAAGTIMMVNEAWCRFSLLNDPSPEPQTYIGDNYLEICRRSAGDSSQGAMEAHEGIRAVLQGTSPLFRLEYPCDSPQEKRWFMMTATPLGEPGAGVVVCHVNISERKQAEEALMRKTRELAALLDTIPAPVFFKDSAMHHVAVNKAFCEFMGLPPERIIGQRNQDLFPPDVAKIYDEGDRAVLDEKKAIAGDEREITDARGRTGWYSIFKSPVHDEEGEIIGLVGLRVDITQHKQGEAERISNLERQRDTLIREVHHRIKNHLQGVTGLLRGYCQGSPETVAAIELAINQVRAISRVYGLQSRCALGVVRLGQFLRDMIEEHPGRIPVDLAITPAMEDNILARETLVPLALVINELLTNAEKHLRPWEGAAEIGASLEQRSGGCILRIFSAPARLPAGFDFESGRGIGAGLDLVKGLLPPEGTRLSIRQADGGVLAELLLTAPVLMKSEEALPDEPKTFT